MGRRGIKAQITVFMIVGLLLLLLLLYFALMREKALGETGKIDPEALPVKNYVETCISTLGKEALTALGLNGGYIYFPLDIEGNPDTYLSTAPTPDYKNPYWWYDGVERIPAEGFMEDQISRYIKENLPECLNDFEAFEASYNIIEHSGMQVLTEIGTSMDSIVLIEARYDLEIKDKFNKTLATLDRFRLEVPIRLYAAYTMAKSILETENAQGFVERKVIDLIALDDEIPDTGGPKFTCGKLKWEVPEINARLRLLMAENFPFIKIEGTKFAKEKYLPLPEKDIATGEDMPDKFNSSYYWYHYIWDVGDEDWSNMRVSLTYDYNWPLNWVNDFYIRPNKYPLLYSNAGKSQDLLSFFCMHIWHFTYDIKFPVKVTIVDDASARNDEYAFIFAFKGSIDHNEPKRESFNIVDYDVENIVTDEEFCSDVSKKVAFFAMENVSAGWEIADVNLTLICGKFRCPLGLTKPDYDAGGIAYWEGLTPYCTLGILEGRKEGYMDSKMFVQTDRDDRAYYLYMNPVKEFTQFTVMKHQFSDDTVFPGQELAKGESAIIMLKAKGANFESAAVYPFNETIAGEDTQKLKLLAKDNYEYDVEIYLMSNEEVIGGYKGAWETAEGDVDRANSVKFHALYSGFADDTEMALFFAGLDSYSKKLKKPELVR